MNLSKVYGILIKYGIPPDNFDFYNDNEWGVSFDSLPLTDIEKDRVIDEILEIRGEYHE